MTAAFAADVTVLDRPDPTAPITHYPANRPPLAPSPLVRLPIGAVRPEGWLRRQLELQADGFHGHLTEISPFLKKENNAWLSKEGIGDHGWEEAPYWLKGYLLCGYLLENDRMNRESQLWIEGILNSQQPDGWFGPDKGRSGLATDLKGREDLWPNMIAMFCLQGYFERTGDRRVPELMTKYFKYLAALPEDKFLVGYWPAMRGGDQLSSILWLYNLTGEPWLLELAQKTHRRTARWDQDLINLHNVNIAQAFREPATYWQLSKNADHLAATERVWIKVRQLYGQVPGGMFGGDENCRPGYDGPRQAIETCGTAEEMLSDGLLLAITGNPVWAERCENAAFNTYPAAYTPDYKALRYLTAPNQPQSDHVSKAPGIENGGNMYEMNPHSHRCCQHNASHAWPYFTQHLWYAAPGNGLAAMLYAPCRVTAKVADGVEATITETTRYPFEETIAFAIALPRAARFPLLLRIPAWCAAARLSLNGQPLSGALAAGKLARLDREWRDGDKLTLTLPMQVRVKRWGTSRNFASVDRGPLTYALQIKENYRRHGGTDAWPAWNIFPASPWNYGLLLGPDPAKDFEVARAAWPADHQPFRNESAPVRLTARAKRIPNWTLDSRGLVHELAPSPVRSAEPAERVTLIPMGAARLRIAAFPVIGDGPDAKEWPAPKRPAFRATASHCFESDTVDALSDGELPKHSNDHAITRFTWWPRKGGPEWVQYDFDPPRKVSGVQVYWFDDGSTGGGCRVPASWRVLYRAGTDWREVANAKADRPARDRFNRCAFDAVETSALRLEVQLQAEYSGGILEWKVE